MTDLELAKKIAAVMPHSAAAAAIRRYEQIVARGIASDIIRQGGWWLVKEPHRSDVMYG